MSPQDVINKGLKLLTRKGEDYNKDPTVNTHESFERAASIVAWFNHDIDKVYMTLIATKAARLATLLNAERQPNNESIEDSFVDLVNYCALWGSKRIITPEQTMSPESLEFHRMITNDKSLK